MRYFKIGCSRIRRAITKRPYITYSISYSILQGNRKWSTTKRIPETIYSRSWPRCNTGKVESYFNRREVTTFFSRSAVHGTYHPWSGREHGTTAAVSAYSLVNHSPLVETAGTTVNMFTIITSN